MLPKSALQALDSSVVKINPILGKGLAVTHMKDVEGYVNSVFRSVASGFPPGLKYLGCRRCDPLQEYAEVSRNRNGKTVYDVAQSNIYLMEYRFTFNDEPPISRYLYLPFVGQAGTIYLSGSRFVISPILSDQVISVGLNSVFVRLLKTKLNFNRISHHYKADKTTESIQVVWSKIYNKKASAITIKATTPAKSTLVHYLLCKHGFSRMFEMYTDCRPVLGGLEIDNEKFPENEWIICSSSQLEPRGFRASYVGTDIRIAIRRSEYTEDVRNLIAGFYYVVDHFPSRIKAEYVDDNRLWMVLMGHVIWSGTVSEGRLFSDTNDHMVSLDGYLDTVYSNKLKAINYECRDIYQLFYRIISTFNEWHMDADDRVCTMYGKELSVLPFVCEDIASGINNLYFNLNAAKKKEFTSKKIVTLMNLNVRQGVIFKLTKEHGEVTTTGTSGDNMALKITNLLVPQSSSSKPTGSKGRTTLADPTKRLHVSIAEVGGAWALPKSAPDGRSRLNLTCNISDTGLIIRDPSKIEFLDNIQRKLKRQ